MLQLGDTVQATASSVADKGSCDAAIAALTEAVLRDMRTQASTLHGWRYDEQGADEIVGVPSSVQLTVNTTESGDHYLVTVTARGVVTGVVIDTRFYHSCDN